MNKIVRRKFLQLSAVGAGALALTAAGCSPNPSTSAPPSTTVRNTAPKVPPPTAASASAPAAQASVAATDSALASNMAVATTQFLESLDGARWDKATYDFTDKERFRWHWTTPSGFPRNGLPLTEMTAEQKNAAFALLQASLSPAGYKKASDIMSLQTELGNDPQLYFVTVFGTPDATKPWGWRWEGHHLSRQFTIVGQNVAMTPFFHGSWPTQTDAGLRALAVEEDSALALINSLQGSKREKAIIQERTLTQHVTGNSPKVTPLESVGIPYSELDNAQQGLVNAIVQAYLTSLPDEVAAEQSARVNSGLNDIHFGWAGSLERKRPQYYRLQGPTFLLEFDNSRNGGTHVHSVWRDFERDFGYNLL